MRSTIKIKYSIPAVLFAILFSCISVPVKAQSEWKAPAFTDTIKNPYASDVKVMDEARKIYESMCWTCHGLKGKGNGPAAVALNPKPADHTSIKVQKEKDGNIYWKISTGKGNMQPYGKTLSSKQRWALVNYIRHLGGSSESSIN